MTSTNCNSQDVYNHILVLDNRYSKKSNFTLIKQCLEINKGVSTCINLYLCIMNVNYEKIEYVKKILEYYYEESYQEIMRLGKVLDYSVYILLPELYQTASDVDLVERGGAELSSKLLFGYLNQIVMKIRGSGAPTRLWVAEGHVSLPVVVGSLMRAHEDIAQGLASGSGGAASAETNRYMLPDLKRLSRFSHVYVGGFFDYFHLGHREYLSIGSLVSRDKFFISVLQKPSLSNNSYTSCSSLGEIMNSMIDNSPVKVKDDLSQPIETRMSNIKEFFNLFHPHHPSIEIISNNRCSNIHLCPMTFVDIPSIAVIVPEETRETAEKLNLIRSERSLKLIELYRIRELVYQTKKISSTDIRGLIFAKRNEELYQKHLDI